MRSVQCAAQMWTVVLLFTSIATDWESVLCGQSAMYWVSVHTVELTWQITWNIPQPMSVANWEGGSPVAARSPESSVCAALSYVGSVDCSALPLTQRVSSLPKASLASSPLVFLEKEKKRKKKKKKIHPSLTSLALSPFLTGRMFVRPNILRTLRRTMIRFLTEHLVRRIWFGQSRLYFILNWLVMRCKLRPELAADAQQTAWWKCRLKSSQVKSVYFNHPSQGNSTNYYLILGSPRQGCAFHKSTQDNK